MGWKTGWILMIVFYYWTRIMMEMKVIIKSRSYSHTLGMRKLFYYLMNAMLYFWTWRYSTRILRLYEEYICLGYWFALRSLLLMLGFSKQTGKIISSVPILNTFGSLRSDRGTLTLGPTFKERNLLRLLDFSVSYTEGWLSSTGPIS